MKEIVHVMFSREQVENRIKEMADQINEEYGMKPLRLICILKGSVFFSCELAKHLKMPVTIDFLYPVMETAHPVQVRLRSRRIWSSRSREWTVC